MCARAAGCRAALSSRTSAASGVNSVADTTLERRLRVTGHRGQRWRARRAAPPRPPRLLCAPNSPGGTGALPPDCAPALAGVPLGPRPRGERGGGGRREDLGACGLALGPRVPGRHRRQVAVGEVVAKRVAQDHVAAERVVVADRDDRAVLGGDHGGVRGGEDRRRPESAAPARRRPRRRRSAMARSRSRRSRRWFRPLRCAPSDGATARRSWRGSRSWIGKSPSASSVTELTSALGSPLSSCARSSTDST